MNPLCQINDSTRLQARPQNTQTFTVSMQTMLNLIDDTSFLLCSGLQHCIGRDVIDEVLAKVGSKICEALITKGLHTANDRCRVNVVAFRHLSRREKKSLFVFVQNLPD